MNWITPFCTCIDTGQCPHDGKTISDILPSKETWLKKCWQRVCIYIALAVYVAYDVTVSFFTIVFGLYMEIVVSIFKPKHLKGDYSGFVYIDNVNQEFNGFLFYFIFYSIHILVCSKTVSKWRIYLHAKTFKLKLKMSSFIFRRQPLVMK